MSVNWAKLLDKIAGLQVLVIGEAMLDSYLEGVAERLCPEAPVPVVKVSYRQDVPGGAANTAANVASLGSSVTFLSVVGDDPEGIRLRQGLANRGVSASHLLTTPKRQTLAKQRVVAASQMLVRFDQGSTLAVNAEIERVLIQQLSQGFCQSDAVIVSDYGYGILTPKVVAAIAQLQSQSPKILAVDSRCLSSYRHASVTLVKPNYREAMQLLGADTLNHCGNGHNPAGDRPAQIAAHSAQLLKLTGARIAAVTLDTEGSLVIEQDQPLYRTYACPQPQAQTAGAGDTFISALTLALAAGASTPTAAELAAAAASVVVGKEGTATCDPQELQACLRSTDHSKYKKLPHQTT